MIETTTQGFPYFLFTLYDTVEEPKTGAWTNTNHTVYRRTEDAEAAYRERMLRYHHNSRPQGYCTLRKVLIPND